MSATLRAPCDVNHDPRRHTAELVEMAERLAGLANLRLLAHPDMPRDGFDAWDALISDLDAQLYALTYMLRSLASQMRAGSREVMGATHTPPAA